MNEPLTNWFRNINPNVYRAIERCYVCPNCGHFTVIHTSYDIINKKCGWCGRKVKLTGEMTVVVCPYAKDKNDKKYHEKSTNK
jgi:DNA-directed RNA polymerase subunit RPC12/RpoP